MIDWLIIGGGIHGLHLAHVLTSTGGVSPERLRVLDPHPAPLARWTANTAITGMAVLRSPVVHHLDLPPDALKRFAMASGEPLHGRYKRPTLAAFNQHSARLIADRGLDGLYELGRADGLRPTRSGWAVQTSRGELTARRVLLAIGLSEQPCWPPWAIELARAGAPVRHVYDPNNKSPLSSTSRAAVVVGSGITAAQFSIALASITSSPVTLLTSHPLQTTEFDSNPCWLGPKCMTGFARDTDVVRRRSLIAAGRNPGTVPCDVADELAAAVREGRVIQRGGCVRNAVHNAGRVTLELECGAYLGADEVWLATGFDPKRPGGPWLGHAIEEWELPCAPCGYPIVDERLCWRRGLYVTGPLAELELGPIARNISGARSAGKRLAEVSSLGDV